MPSTDSNPPVRPTRLQWLLLIGAVVLELLWIGTLVALWKWY